MFEDLGEQKPIEEWNAKSSNIYVEDLGEEKLIYEWNSNKVYIGIKQRLKELHLLGIAHNYVANIHVSVSGKISLIDFGLPVCTSSGELQQKLYYSV